MIEVGEFVRTKNGKIEKIKIINEYVTVIKHDNSEDTFVPGINWYAESGREINKEDIVKHSFNIIDLIEEGDYVNGKLVYSIGTAIGNLPIVNHTDGTFTPSNMIKSIVTKEQFEQIKYKVIPEEN